jgi:hypothetical protein
MTDHTSSVDSVLDVIVIGAGPVAGRYHQEKASQARRGASTTETIP